MFLAAHEELAAVSSALYILHLSNASFGLEEQAGSPNVIFPAEVSLTSARTQPGEIEEKIRRAAATNRPIETAREVILPFARAKTCLFVLVLITPRNVPSWQSVQDALTPLLPAYVARRVGRIMENSRTRIDYRASWEDFMGQLGEIVLEGSGLQFGALREVRNDRLDCLAAWGLRGDLELRSLSWAKNRFEPFALAAAGEVTPVRDVLESNASRITSIPGLESIRGFIAIPVYSGKVRFGVLTLATSIPYDFAPAEISALETLGNLVGVVVAHYRNPSGPAPDLGSLTEVSVRTSLEIIAGSARHEGRVHVDNAMTLLGQLLDHRYSADFLPTVKQIEAALLDLSITMDKIRSAAHPPEYRWERVSVRALWEEAVNQFSGRIDSLDIEIVPPKIDAHLYCYRDWIVSVFLQLILNSIDAFGRRGFGLKPPPKSGRRIGLSVDPQRRNDSEIVLRYWDNATGISPVKIKSRPEDDGLPVARRIFRPESSSKGGQGSGWGMTLARTALAEHSGSIELTKNSVDGVVFQITIPTNAEQET